MPRQVQRLLSARPALVAAAGAGLGWLGFYAVWLALEPGGPHGLTVFADTAYLAPVVAAAGLAVYAWRRGPAGLRRFWALMAASNALWLAAEILWSIRELGFGSVPFPWWTDAGYLSSYALIPVALFAALKPSLRTVRPAALLDGALVVGVLALLWWLIVLRPLTIAGDPAAIVGVAYPSFGLALIGALVATRLLPARQGNLGVRLVGAGVACAALADGLYTHAVITHSYLSGDWIGLGWQAEAVLFSLGALVSARGLDERRDWARFRDPAPLGAGLVVTGTLACLLAVLVVSGRDGKGAAGVVGATIALALLLTARLWLLLVRTAEPRELSDPATGAYDAGYFEDQLRRLAARGRHFGDPFSVAQAEIDGTLAFELAAVGAEVAGKLVRACREVDAVARLGEDSFGVLLPSVEPEEALAIAEGLRAEVAKEAVRIPSQSAAVGVTISVGVASWTREDGPQSVTERAEDALALAKRLGGNQVRGAAADFLPFRDGELAERFEVLLALARMADRRESDDAGHSRAIASLSREIALTMGLDAEAASRAYVAGLLHDLGKIALPESMLRKPGPLDRHEWVAMFGHPGLGAELIERIAELRDAAPIVAAHHERWDGSGYPRGLAGEQIPLEARIVGVADALVSMTGERSYRRALSMTTSLVEIWRQSGERFDPSVVSALLALSREGRLELELQEPEADPPIAALLGR